MAGATQRAEQGAKVPAAQQTLHGLGLLGGGLGAGSGVFDAAGRRLSPRRASIGSAVRRRPRLGLIVEASIRCTRFAEPRHLAKDYANLVYSFKPLIDGLVEHGVLLDDTFAVLAIESYHQFGPDGFNLRNDVHPPGYGEGVEIKVRSLR